MAVGRSMATMGSYSQIFQQLHDVYTLCIYLKVKGGRGRRDTCKREEGRLLAVPHVGIEAMGKYIQSLCYC